MDPKKIEAARRAYNDAQERLTRSIDAIDGLADDATAESIAEAQAEFDAAEQDTVGRKAEVERLERIARAREDHPPLVIAEAGQPATAKGALQEERTYRPDNSNGHGFFRDLINARKGDHEARERLTRNEAESRDLTTTATDGGGFVPPLYMGDYYAEAPRASRPFADVVPKIPLPSVGMTMSFPRVTTAPAVAQQSSENTAMNETELVETTLSVPVVTIGGIEDVSIQLLDRSQPGIDMIIWQALQESYDSVLDTALLAGAGSGYHTGIRAVSSINTVTYTDSSPTAAEHLGPVYDAIQKIASNRYRNPTHVIMHPRRAAFIAGNAGSSVSLFQQGQLVQAFGTQNGGFVQTFAGLPVVVDANIATTRGASTNEDEIYVVYAPDLYLAEGPMRADVFHETLSAEGTVRFRLFAYSAFASGRQPKSITAISGTGLTTPSFA